MDLFRSFHPLANHRRRYCRWCRSHQQQQEVIILHMSPVFTFALQYTHNLLRQIMAPASLSILGPLISLRPALKVILIMDRIPLLHSSSLVFIVNLTVDCGNVQY